MERLLYQLEDVGPAIGIVLVLIVLALVVGKVLVGARGAVRRSGNSALARAYRALKTVPVVPERAARLPHGALVHVEGKVAGAVTMLSDQLTGRNGVVAVRYKVSEERLKSNASRRHIGDRTWVDLVDVTQGVSFRLRLDDGAEIAVDGAEIVVASIEPSAFARPDASREATERVAAFAAAVGVSTELLGVQKTQRFATWNVGEGDDVHVVGRASVAADGSVRLVAGADFPVVLFRKHRKDEVEVALARQLDGP